MERVFNRYEPVESESEEGEERDGLQHVKHQSAERARRVTGICAFRLDDEGQVERQHEETRKEVGHGERSEEVRVDACGHSVPRDQQYQHVGHHGET